MAPTCCVVCTKPATNKCGRCKCVSYCSRTCQAADWKSRHKQACAFLKTAKAAVATVGRIATSSAGDAKTCAICARPLGDGDDGGVAGCARHPEVRYHAACFASVRARVDFGLQPSSAAAHAPASTDDDGDEPAVDVELPPATSPACARCTAEDGDAAPLAHALFACGVRAGVRADAVAQDDARAHRAALARSVELLRAALCLGPADPSADHATHRAPFLVAARTSLGMALVEQGKRGWGAEGGIAKTFDAAAACYTAALRDDPEYIDAHVYIKLLLPPAKYGDPSVWGSFC